jgi:phosphatidylglycerol:prolipoprotein diacylglycerol transferase
MHPYTDTCMYPYIHIGSMQIGTFGLMLWLAAVCATVVLHKNFLRNKIDADALNVVTLVVLAGILGAKMWHELQSIRDLEAAWHQILLPGLSHPLEVLMNFLRWFQAGFAWYGGLLAGIITLMVLGTTARFKGPLEGTLGARIGPLRMLDLAAPATAIGYGIGRIGCLTSGDGDYGINTTLPWGVHMAQNALVPPTPPDALVQPTPVYELLYALLLFWLLWKLGERYRPVGWMTGLYLVLSGIGRFLVEFVRINPKLYFHHTMSNAQVAALGSVLLGAVLLAAAARINQPWVPRLADTSVA